MGMDCSHDNEQWTLVTVTRGDPPEEIQTLTCPACAAELVAATAPGVVVLCAETAASGDFPTDDIEVIA
jgi:hypothetical protein